MLYRETRQPQGIAPGRCIRSTGEQLICGTPMSVGVSRVYEYVQDRRHAGQIADPSAVGRSSLDGQPPHTTLYLRITDNVVREARFQTSGCGFLMACCAAAIELSLDRRPVDCRQIEPPHLVAHLGGLPDNRLYCAELAVTALRDALSQLRPSDAE